jgi:hypothetical protein
MRLTCLAKPFETSAVLRKRRIRLGDFFDFKWPEPGRCRLSLPVAVILTRLAIDLFVFIFVILTNLNTANTGKQGGGILATSPGM